MPIASVLPGPPRGMRRVRQQPSNRQGIAAHARRLRACWAPDATVLKSIKQWVSKWLYLRKCFSRLPRSSYAPVRRYERAHPGEMIHIDIKKLGRFEKLGHRITGDRTGQSNSRGVGWELS
jgi:hypothetical protein